MDKEISEMKNLKTILKQSTMKLRQLKQDEDGFKAAFEDLSDEMRVVEDNKMQKKEKVNQLEEESLFIEKQEQNKEEKLKRTVHQLKKAFKKLQAKDLSIYEQNLEIRQLSEANDSVLKKLHNMATECPDVAPKINKYAEEQNIDLMPQTSNSSSSVYSSSEDRSSNSDSSRSLTIQIAPITLKKVDISFK